MILWFAKEVIEAEDPDYCVVRWAVIHIFVYFFRDETLERLELSEYTVNPGQPKTGPQDFELLKLLGKGGYGKVSVVGLLQFVGLTRCQNLELILNIIFYQLGHILLHTRVHSHTCMHLQYLLFNWC